MFKKLFQTPARLEKVNSQLQQIDKQNNRTLKKIAAFRKDYAQNKTDFNAFSLLKHKHPFFGFVPCQAASTDFTLFHANDDVVAWEYLWFGADQYETEIVTTWIQWCKESSLVYDIGAYTGLMSILAALSNKETQIHLFEPMDRTIERAKINIKANYVEQSIQLHNKAASDSEHEASINLYREENFLGPGNSIYDKNLPILDVKKIQCIKIDDYLPDLKPTIIKIDVEGHEKECLAGMIETIKRSRPKMIIEVWEHTRKEVLSQLTELGYECTPFEKKEVRVMNYKCLPGNTNH